MKVTIKHNGVYYNVNLKSSIDISVSINPDGILAWGAPKLKIEPFQESGWVGDVSTGSPVNFNNILFNPHAHSTHTECVGHISPQKESLNKELTDFFFISKLITLSPKKKSRDCVITKKMVSDVFVNHNQIDALIIRTIPNEINKREKNYSHTNPPYFLKEAMDYIVNQGVRHLLVDVPSVDKEKDGGQLVAHKSFWKFPDDIRHGCTITELIYVPNSIEDGMYLLNLQCVPFENDASPSRPLLFKLKNRDA
tara:strand:+ start:644 stop:1399 length:756 start_codon:yes stop_codon:yes gene_type:complete